MSQSMPGLMSPEMPDFTEAERQLVGDLDNRRRLQLLRFITPGLLVLFVIGATGELRVLAPPNILQVAVGLIALSIACWATFTRHVTLASNVLLIGIAIRAVVVILLSGPTEDKITPATTSSMYLLLLPIAVACVFTAPSVVGWTSFLSLLFSAALFLFIPMSPAMHALLRTPENAVLIVLPLVVPLLAGFLLYIGSRGFRHMQGELANLYVAYTREKEVERLRELFIANVNHELRTPIMALQGYLALAERHGERGDSASQMEMIREGRKVGKDLATLVRSVLNIRRIKTEEDQTNLTEFAFYATFMQTIDMLDRWGMEQQDRELHVNLPQDVSVRADEARVREVIANLLSNAMKYSGPGTPIEVTGHVISDPKEIRRWISADRVASPLLEIAIHDYGFGIPPDQMRLLFEPFVRLERDIYSPVTGTGLGLALCRSYLQAMGGNIIAESSGVFGEGSTFRMVLPLAPEQARPDQLTSSGTDEHKVAVS
jgi:signal transduction histidine kinase